MKFESLFCAEKSSRPFPRRCEGIYGRFFQPVTRAY